MTDKEALARFICAAEVAGHGPGFTERTAWCMYDMWKRLCNKAEAARSVSTGVVHDFDPRGEGDHVELAGGEEPVIELSDVVGC